MLLEARIWDDAALVFADALKKRDTSYEAHVGLALAWTEQNRLREAQREARVAVSLDPKRARAHHVAADIYRRRKAYPEAIAEARQAVAIAPKDPVFRLGLARVLEASGKTKEAVESYERFLAMVPDAAETRALRQHVRTLH